MHATLRFITALTLSLLTGAVLADESSANTTATLISQGELQLQNSDIDGAIATFTKAIEQEPGSSLAHTRLGGAYLLGQHYDNAIGQFQQAIGLDANNASAFIGMGIAYLHANRLGAAKAALGEAKRLAPDKAEQIDDLINRVAQRSGVPHQ